MHFNNELSKKQDIILDYLEGMFEVKDVPENILRSMNYSLFAGGKRIRPVLALSICEALGGNSKDILPFGCAIELIHTYSLIHDDLPAMDNDDLRRGKPTNHKVFGEAMAILAGDGLLNMAYETVLGAVLKNNSAEAVKAAEFISKAAGIRGMIGGQVIDIESEGTRINIDRLKEMHKKKTGALIEASCAAGCLIAKREDILDTVLEYSKNLGIAFQIVDDILDVVGSSEKLGKNTGSDMQNEKSTYVSIFGLEKSKSLAEEYSQRAKSLAEKIDENGFLVNLTEYLLHRDS